MPRAQEAPAAGQLIERLISTKKLNDSEVHGIVPQTSKKGGRPGKEYWLGTIRAGLAPKATRERLVAKLPLYRRELPGALVALAEKPNDIKASSDPLPLAEAQVEALESEALLRRIVAERKEAGEDLKKKIEDLAALDARAARKEAEESADRKLAKLAAVDAKRRLEVGLQIDALLGLPASMPERETEVEVGLEVELERSKLLADIDTSSMPMNVKMVLAERAVTAFGKKALADVRGVTDDLCSGKVKLPAQVPAPEADPAETPVPAGAMTLRTVEGWTIGI